MDRIRCSEGTGELHLDAWCDYIAWARQALLTGGKKNEFAAILNDCVNRCSDMKRDLRYVKVCCEFAEHCNAPLEFLAWVETNGAAQQYALFWLTKATLLEEVARDTAAAEGAFAEGIRRGAKPVETLRAKRDELHARVAAKLRSAAVAPDTAEETAGGGGRVALGSLGAKAGMSRTAHAGPGQLKSQLPESNTRGRKAVAVYEGDEAEGGGEAQAKQWIEYGSEREAVKENKDVARQWSRATLPQQPGGGPAVAAARPGFAIYNENDPEDIVPAPAVIAVAGAPAAARAVSLPALPTVTLARTSSAPAAKTVVAPAAATKKKAKRDGPPSPIGKPGGKVRAGFDEAMLEGETLSFEEVRAARWQAVEEEARRARLRREAEERTRAEAVALLRAQEELQLQLRSDRQRPAQRRAPSPDASFQVGDTTLDTMNYEALVRGAAKTANLDALDDLRNVYEDTLDFGGRHGKSFLRAPTVNTLAVMNEVEHMFSDDLLFNDSGAGAGAATGVSSRSMVAVPPPGAYSDKQAFDVYEDEDSLESFRASMSASTIAAKMSSGPGVAAPSAAAKFEVFEDSFVAPKPKPKEAAAKKPVTPAKPVFEVFSDDIEDDAAASKSAPPAPAAAASGIVMDPWAAQKQKTSNVAQLRGFCDHAPQRARFEDDGKYFWVEKVAYDLLQIGGGVESVVFRGEDVTGDDGDATCAIKVFKPVRATEFYLLAQLEKRCSKEQLRLFPRVLSYHKYADQSALLTVFNENGSVATLLEVWAKSGGMPEELALFYSVELLRAVEALHGARVLHNDITPDNVLMCLDSSNMVDKQSLQLVDFSCALDLAEFGGAAVFRGAGRCAVQCPRMRRGESWVFEQDYFAVASIVHSFLFGRPLSEDGDRGGSRSYRPAMQEALWEQFFAAMLAPSSLTAGQHAESQALLKRVRIALETYRLQISNVIQKALTKQAIHMFEK